MYEYKGETYKSKRALAGAFGYRRELVYMVETRTGLSTPECVELLNQFFSNYPWKMSTTILLFKIPVYIYQGRAFESLRDLCRYIGVSSNAINSVKRDKGTVTIQDTLNVMSTLRGEYWFDGKTGQRSTIGRLSEKYRKPNKQLILEGLATKKEVNMLEGTLYNPNSKIYTPKADFEKVLARFNTELIPK